MCFPGEAMFAFKGKNLLPEGGEFFPLRAVPYGMENHFYNIRWLLCL